MSRKPDGLHRYMRRVSAVLPGFGAQKRAVLSEIHTVLLEIPHAETMSYEILCAAAGAPEEIAAPHVEAGVRRERRLCVWRLALFTTALILGLQLSVWDAFSEKAQRVIPRYTAPATCCRAR